MQNIELNPEGQKAVKELGAAINSAVEKSSHVVAAIEHLREAGYELQLTLKLEIGVRELDSNEQFSDENDEDFEREENVKFELTDEDLRTLRRMKIRFDE